MSNTQSETTNAAGSEARRIRRWKRLIRVLQVALFIGAGLAVWLIGFSGDDGPVPVVPDTDSKFSLDLEVVASTDHDVVYIVEQRARPNYRIFSFDPSTGDAETIFTVPEDAIIYGLALSPDRETLAVGYTSDFDTGTIATRVTDTITPVVAGDDLYYLMVGEDSARHSVGLLDSNGATSVVAFEGSDLDLDHLVAGVETGEERLTLIESRAIRFVAG